MNGRVRRTRPLAVSGALVGLLMVAGCSTLHLAYTVADGMVVSRAEQYLALNAREQARLEAQSEALIAWHRRDMLPRYAAFFRAQADIADAGGWTRPQLDAAFATFRRLVDETVRGAAPFVAAVLVDQTTPAKLDHLKARMAEANAAVRAEHGDETPKETVQRWTDRRVERISRFTGPLDDGQVAIIGEHTARGADLSLRWLDNRRRRQDALLVFLRSGTTTVQIARFVHRILIHADEIVAPDYRAVSEARWQRRADMYYDVLVALSDAQRLELATTLRGYAVDMVRLADV